MAKNDFSICHPTEKRQRRSVEHTRRTRLVVALLRKLDAEKGKK